MRCKCGYSFSNEVSGPDRKFESFAVIRDRDYRVFIKSETRVLASKGSDAKLRALARSSKFVGSLMECPKCLRAIFSEPGGANLVIFQREV